jgi:hypothetical protein
MQDAKGRKSTFTMGKSEHGLSSRFGFSWYSNAHRTERGQFRYLPLVVYFCGKEYWGVQVLDHTARAPQIIWSYRDFCAFMRMAYGLVPVENLVPAPRLIKEPEQTPRAEKFLLDRRATVAVWNPYDADSLGGSQKTVWKVDRSDLHSIKFQSVVDPWQAFQEISMWVANMARPDRPMVKLSDRDVAKKHGYDKWSFRKMPSQER